ncbi:MAG: PHP domain-containing protein [Dehalococcoidia bacterium]|nr:PHP domain-containing protein [Dehalococcoidia bacterium]
MKADLHLHTTASDGRLSPRELVRKASGINLDVIAVTDHDSVGGIDPALEEAGHIRGILVIPGIEINTDVHDGETHILGYFIDHHDETLGRELDELRNSRYERGWKMVNKLHDLGMNVKWERVLEIADGGPVGRPHIALALQERQYVSTIREAFSRYIGRNAAAYVERKKVTPLEALKLIAEAGGLSVLAHPAEIDTLESLLSELKSAGLVGLEVHYARYTADTIQRLLALAARHDLIPTGGSDYHGLDNTVGVEIGTVGPPQESVERLLAVSKQRRMVT